MADNTTESGTRVRKAGLFDMRIIIGALLGIYGVITLVTGLFVSDAQIDKSDGLNINLAGGIGMLVVAGLFIGWARWRPIIVPDDPADTPADTPDDQPAGH
jgi:hypothetical protein